MNKTPEQLAKEWAIDWHKDCDYPDAILEIRQEATKHIFLAGYQAAQEHAHAALEEAEARMQELRDQLMEESGGRLKLFKDDADAKAAYQECLEEVELDKAWQEGYKAAQDQLADADKVMPDACEHILDMEKMVDVNGWISVKDRMPEQDMQILAWSGGLGDIPPFCTGGYELWNWSIKFSPNDCRLTGITYWMPLPEPPKEEE